MRCLYNSMYITKWGAVTQYGLYIRYAAIKDIIYNYEFKGQARYTYNYIYNNYISLACPFDTILIILIML